MDEHLDEHMKHSEGKKNKEGKYINKTLAVVIVMGLISSMIPMNS